MPRLLSCLLLLWALAACGSATPASIPDLGPSGPYRTATPSRTPTVLPALTEVLLPTPTPFIYVVVQGDTLSVIAQRHGVSLAALLAANPGVQPAALSVGTELVIPTGDDLPGEPTPTPVALPFQQARCWPEAAGGLWCFALARNDYPEPLENLSARFSLLDGGGQEIVSQTAYGLLNVLPPGASMPLAVHFPSPIDPPAAVRVQALTAIRLLPGDTRYLPVLLENILVQVEVSGRTARVGGRAVLTAPGAAETLWILASAYDLAGNVVGVRRWESPEILSEGAPVAFDFSVSSLGPPIAQVEFLAEARP